MTTPGLWHDGHGTQGYGSQCDLLGGSELLEEVGDRVRKGSEAADSLQGGRGLTLVLCLCVCCWWCHSVSSGCLRWSCVSRCK
jgi:hypothetical protein